MPKPSPGLKPFCISEIGMEVSHRLAKILWNNRARQLVTVTGLNFAGSLAPSSFGINVVRPILRVVGSFSVRIHRLKSAAIRAGAISLNSRHEIRSGQAAPDTPLSELVISDVVMSDHSSSCIA